MNGANLFFAALICLKRVTRVKNKPPCFFRFIFAHFRPVYVKLSSAMAHFFAVSSVLSHVHTFQIKRDELGRRKNN